MNREHSIGDRHLLTVDGLEDKPVFEKQFIRIIVSERWAGTKSGQFLTSCLVNLLCRQIPLVGSIEIVSPKVKCPVPLPTGEAGDFPNSLQAFGAWATGGIVGVSTTETEVKADFTVFVGEAPVSHIYNSANSLLAIGDGWKAWVGIPGESPRAVEARSINPLGPFFAAALVAGEIFKKSRGIRRGRYISGGGYSLWSGETSVDWNRLADGPEIAGARIPAVHIMGAGAVGNAMVYAIASSGLHEAYIVVIDDDKYDATNLNRCLLAGWADLNEYKVDAVVRMLERAGLGAFPFRGSVKSYMTSSRAGLRKDVGERVDNLIFELVASCVDKGVSRQDIQGLGPQVLLGGSTLDLQAKSNFYSGRVGTACLACFNPAERGGEKIRALESRLRQMEKSERVVFLTKEGLDVAAIEEYLAGAECGGLGEASLQDFASRPPASFSAGFVSLSAGLLATAVLLQKSVFSEVAPRRGDMTTFNFLNGGFLDSGLGADDACERKCQKRSEERVARPR